LYSYVETPQLISKPSDNVSNPFSLPMGHYVLSDGSAGVIINSTSPNAGSNNFTATGAAYNSYLSPIVPAYNFVPGITMWQNDQTSSLQYKIDLRVPYLAVTSVSGYPSGGYGYGYFLFKDKTTQKTFWLGMEFFNNWAPDATAERVGCDCGNGGTNMPNVQSNLNSPHTYASPTSDSAAFASSAFTDWRTFGFTVSPSQFSAAISAIQQQYPNSNFTNDLRNYQLIQVSLDTETSRPHYDPNISSSLQGQAVIGAQFRNLTVSEIAGQGQVLPIVPSVTPIVPTTPITITAPTTSTTQTTPVTSTTQVTPSVPAVACSLSVNHASVYSNNSDTWVYTGTSNPSGYAIKRYGTKNGVMDLNGDSVWGPTNFNLTYGPVGPGTEGTYVRWFTISDPNTGALLCTSNQATMTILPAVAPTQTSSVSSTNQMASALESMMQVLQSMKNSLK
jgi:peroxiredoxin